MLNNFKAPVQSCTHSKECLPCHQVSPESIAVLLVLHCSLLTIVAVVVSWLLSCVCMYV